MKTTVIDNFMSDDELFEIERSFRLNYDTKFWKEATEQENVAHAWYWYPGPSYQEEICYYMNKKVNAVFGNNNYCDNWHILHAYKPYGIHTDAYDEVQDSYTHSLPENHKFGWTFIIPLDDYDTNTIIFNEQSEHLKVVDNWIARENRQPQGLITDEQYEKYLTHHSRHTVDYFSIESAIPWKKGRLIAMPRAAFHCSDNFVKKKLVEKRALIGWTWIVE